jgi:serine/threonine protein kinase
MDLNTHRKLQGQWHQVEGEDYYFCAGSDLYPPARAHLPGFWTGAEGLAHPIKDRQGHRYIFKSFTIQCPERDQRMKWLCERRLCDCGQLWLLHGAPYRHLPAPMDAQICPFVEGRTWDSWKADNHLHLTPDQRLYLAFSLAEAVHLLETGLDLRHSDLSPGNVIIDLNTGKDLPTLSLIDFDAFYHPAVPILPAGKGQTLGTPGYQAPEFLRASQVIRTDRFALAVFLHEFLALGDDPDLGEPDHRFFEQEDLNQGKAKPTGRFKNYWGQDLYDLVARALGTQMTDERPAPQEWCEALLALGAPPVASGLLMTAEKDGKRQRFELKSSRVDLATALHDPALALQLHRANGGYQVRRVASQQGPAKPAILQNPHSGKHLSLDDAPQAVQPGNVIIMAGWELSFHARQG